MPYLPLADSCPSVLSKSTLIVEVMLPEFVLKASKARLLTLGDLAKALKKSDNSGLELNPEEKSAFIDWLTQHGLFSHRGRKPKEKNNEKKELPPANPLIVPLERIQLGVGLDGRTGTNRADDHLLSLSLIHI